MSLTPPYQPMTPQRVASEEEVQAMHAKLAGRAQGKVSDGPGSVPKGIDAASPPAHGGSVERPRLEWDKPKSKDDTGVKTKCKRYSCARVMGPRVKLEEVLSGSKSVDGSVFRVGGRSRLLGGHPG